MLPLGSKCSGVMAYQVDRLQVVCKSRLTIASTRRLLVSEPSTEPSPAYPAQHGTKSPPA